MDMTESKVEAPPDEPVETTEGSGEEDVIAFQKSLSLVETTEPATETARGYMSIFRRVTGVFGLLLLVAGLLAWKFHPGQHRLALLLLVCAMFLSILHYYSLESRDVGESAA